MIIIPSIEVKEKEKERALQPAKLSLLIWTVKKIILDEAFKTLAKHASFFGTEQKM